MWQTFLRPTSLDEALDLLHQHAGRARVIAGGTDVLIELQRGVSPTDTLIDVTSLRALKYVREADDHIALGALATHNDVIASPACVRRALPLAQACLEVGAPQIRTRATVAGNLITASPANDTITPLIALGASVVLVSRAGGERVVPLAEFYRGVRRTALVPGELLREIRVPTLAEDQPGLFLKLGLRRAQAISVIDVALVLTLAGDEIAAARIGQRRADYRPRPQRRGLPRRPPTRRRHLPRGRPDRRPRRQADRRRARHRRLSPRHGGGAGGRGTAPSRGRHPRRRLARRARAARCRPARTQSCRVPASAARAERGVRGEASERNASGAAAGWPRERSEERAQRERSGPGAEPGPRERSEERTQRERSGPGTEPGPPPADAPATQPFDGSAIRATVNGRAVTLPASAARKTLLDALREDVGLTGTKEGCAEGECGACTVWLDGQAAMACLVPAAQAHGAALTTIEGLASGDALHPLQQAFIDHGAVQCGYCIPGMLMAGAKLLQEHPQPAVAQVQAALSGNICRCTGYRKIVASVLAAAGQPSEV